MSTLGQRLTGKSAIITGSGSGIGRATAVLFARHGARVVVNTDRNIQGAEETVAMIRAEGGEAIFVQGDVASGPDVQRLVSSALESFGRLDIVVNNAAIVIPNKIEDIPEEDWDRTTAVVLKAVFWTTKYAIPAFRASGGGSVVNVSSINSGIVANTAWPAYTAAKGGVNALTKQLAVDYGAENIRFNAVCPASVSKLPLEEQLRTEPHAARHRVDAYPLRRFGSPQDVAFAILFLASDEAAFITGSLLVVDGGLTSQTPELLLSPSGRERTDRQPLFFKDEHQ